MTKPAIFLDRDGVLNRYLPGDYVKTPDELDLLPGAGEAVARLNALGYPVYLISNQQGVAKGLMTDGDLDAVDAKLRAEWRMRAARSSVRTTAHTTRTLIRHTASPSRDDPGSRHDHDLDLARSVFVGDTETDAQAARAAVWEHLYWFFPGKFAGRPEVATDTGASCPARLCLRRPARSRRLDRNAPAELTAKTPRPPR
jgi:histidinol-phosphate phosphatase family protein